jgi:UDP-N-acetyl-D-galactosamine dehydrogenase
MKKNETVKIRGPVGVVGLGYVGLPLAAAFAKSIRVVGFDIKKSRVAELQRGHDSTGEVSPEDLATPNLTCTTDAKKLRACEFIIVAVPTPIDEAKIPDLSPVRGASEIVGEQLQRGQTVVYESTVYPGVTEDYCVPILEAKSGLKFGQFKVGYSPERINPGDREHTIDRIIKIVSGCDADTLDRVAALYSLVAKAGVHRAPNIMTAEAAKVIENIQRDLNIALMNELSQIFARLGLHTDEVLAAAGTKWNFHKYHPGLVGGHCIGVDPYYLTHRAMELGYHPRVILSGRGVNDDMPRYVGELVIRELNKAGKVIKGSKVLVMGLTFKEDVPDTRNSKVADTIRYLREFGVEVIGHDPTLTEAEVDLEHLTVKNVPLQKLGAVDAILIANRHREFKQLTLADLKKKMPRHPILVDIKHLFPRAEAVKAGFAFQSL